MLTQIGLIAALSRLGDQAGNLAAFQGLMLVLAFTGLAIGGLVTERRRVEQQLRRNQESGAEIFRLGSAGELATAIAHEINQPLTAIANYNRLIQQYLEDGKGDRTMAIEAASKVAAQVERTDAVVKSFRDLVRRGRPQIRSESVHEVFRETLGLISPTLQREGVDVTVSIERDTRRIMVDKLQIEQVLINLISNAAEAMSANASGAEASFVARSKCHRRAGRSRSRSLTMDPAFHRNLTSGGRRSSLRPRKTAWVLDYHSAGPSLRAMEAS